MHDKITVGLDLSMCHFFDSVSEDTITSKDQLPAVGEASNKLNEEEE